MAATDEAGEVFQVVTEDHLADPAGSVLKGRLFCLLVAGLFIVVVILTLVAFRLCLFLRWFNLRQSKLDRVAFRLRLLRVPSREDLNAQYDLVNFSVHSLCVRYCSETSLQVRAASDARDALHRLFNREEIYFAAQKIARADLAPCDLAKFQEGLIISTRFFGQFHYFDKASWLNLVQNGIRFIDTERCAKNELQQNCALP